MTRLFLLAAFVGSLVPAHAHKVRVDFDHGAHFAQYKTYRLVLPPNTPSPNPDFPNRIVLDRIGGFIEEALAAKGMKRVNSGEDLQIAYRIEVYEHPTYTTFSNPYWPGWGWGYWNDGWGGPGWQTGISTTTVQIDYQGVLVVDIVDPRRQKVVFEGRSSQSVSSRPEKNNKKLAKAVTEVLAHYPPQP